MHWGKLHFLTASSSTSGTREAADFIALRRELDPDGVFLNDHLRAALRLSAARARLPRPRPTPYRRRVQPAPAPADRPHGGAW